MNLIGKLLGNRYEILEKIGIGGMAIVYRAKCHVLNRFVAIKILKDEFTTDSEFIKKFNSEAQAAASLTHPNIVSIFDVGVEDNLYYIVMELIQGKTLKEIIVEDERLSWKWSTNIAIQIASALETAHKNGIVHRDIKPHNIIITEEGRAKVTDFGIAKAVSNSTITAFGTTIGSVHYFSPEHARGGYTDAKSDIYSLGVVLYEMLTGRVPFDADTPVSVALKQVQEEPIEPVEINPAIPVSLNRIILKAMQKDPNRRYQTATEMLNDLNMALKRPDEDFVIVRSDDMTSRTQRVGVVQDKKNENEDDDEPKTKFGKFLKNHPFIKFLMIMAILAIIFVVAMLATMASITGSRPEQAVIPNVSGMNEAPRMTKEQAQEALNTLGFNDIEIVEEYSDEIEAGYVIKQNPDYKADYNYNLSEKITLTVSKGAKKIILPISMVGKKIDNLKEELDKLEANYNIIEETSEEVEKGIVLEVDQADGTEISASLPINIKVSAGSQYKDVTMISVMGKNEADARAALNAIGIKNITVENDEDTSKTEGVVLTQSIPVGTVVKENETIMIVINKHPVRSTVTVELNLKSLMNYVPPEPVTTTKPANTTKPAENETDSNNTSNETTTNTNATATTTTTPPIKKSKVRITVGGETIFSETRELTTTSIIARYTGSGVKEIKVYVDDVVQDKSIKTVDLSKGNTTINIE